MEDATEKLTVTLPDGKALELPAGATGADAAAAIGPGLAKAALAIKVDGELRDLSAPLPAAGAQIGILTDRDPEALELIRHDAAHVMAEARRVSVVVCVVQIAMRETANRKIGAFAA